MHISTWNQEALPLKFLKCHVRARWWHRQICFPSGQLHGRVTVVTEGRGWGTMFSSHCLGIIESFIFEFVGGVWWDCDTWGAAMCWAPQLSCGAASWSLSISRVDWQPNPHSLGPESTTHHPPALLPSPPSTSGRVSVMEESPKLDQCPPLAGPGSWPRSLGLGMPAAR